MQGFGLGNWSCCLLRGGRLGETGFNREIQNCQEIRLSGECGDAQEDKAKNEEWGGKRITGKGSSSRNKTAWLFLAGTKRKLVKSLTGRPQLPSGA